MFKRIQYLFVFMLVILVSCSLLSVSCDSDDDDDDNDSAQLSEDELLDSSFRIDISTIVVDFDVYPENAYVDAHAVVNFTMRENQSVPLFHFIPALRDNAISELMLDDEMLNLDNDADAKIVTFDSSDEQALELQRSLVASVEHTLEVTYRFNLYSPFFAFFTDCNDIAGNGNEVFWPTINTPHELARHIVTFNVMSEEEMALIGSGSIEKQETDGSYQQWVLDSTREIASYTLMFILIPAADIEYEERVIDGVTVRAMAYTDSVNIESSFVSMETWLPELRQNLGAFPMDSGLSFFLTSGGGGMEYYGATITSLWALEHEVFHMYFGCSTVAKTYRDSWWDEAINVWYEDSNYPDFQAISDSYRSNMVSSRTPISPGFDTRAYNEGAQIFQAVAEELGSRENMIGFLSYVHQNYHFKPFNTFDLLEYLKAYSGVDMYDDFLNWLYDGHQTYYKSGQSPHSYAQPPDMTPPEHIRQKYGLPDHIDMSTIYQ